MPGMAGAGEVFMTRVRRAGPRAVFALFAGGEFWRWHVGTKSLRKSRKANKRPFQNGGSSINGEVNPPRLMTTSEPKTHQNRDF